MQQEDLTVSSKDGVKKRKKDIVLANLTKPTNSNSKKSERDRDNDSPAKLNKSDNSLTMAKSNHSGMVRYPEGDDSRSVIHTLMSISCDSEGFANNVSPKKKAQVRTPKRFTLSTKRIKEQLEQERCAAIMENLKMVHPSSLMSDSDHSPPEKLSAEATIIPQQFSDDGEQFNTKFPGLQTGQMTPACYHTFSQDLKSALGNMTPLQRLQKTTNFHDFPVAMPLNDNRQYNNHHLQGRSCDEHDEALHQLSYNSSTTVDAGHTSVEEEEDNCSRNSDLMINVSPFLLVLLRLQLAY